MSWHKLNFLCSGVVLNVLLVERLHLIVRIIHAQAEACATAQKYLLEKLLSSSDSLHGLLALGILNAIDASGLVQVAHPESSSSATFEPSFAILRCLGTLAVQGFCVPNVTLSHSLGRERMEQVSVCLWECLVLRLRRLLTLLDGRTSNEPIKCQLELMNVLKKIFGAATDALDTAAATEVVALVVGSSWWRVGILDLDLSSWDIESHMLSDEV